MPVMRLGYAHVRVGAMGAGKSHYPDTLGMRVTAEGDGRIHLKGWDEFDHHSVVLEEGGAGLARLGSSARTPTTWPSTSIGPGPSA
jgi:catechol 2,3-dioxygenase